MSYFFDPRPAGGDPRARRYQLGGLGILLALAGCAESGGFEGADAENDGGGGDPGSGDGGAGGAGGDIAGGSSCGNGELDPGELCDGTEFGGETCASIGFAGGVLLCRADCAFELSECQAVLCGNGTIDVEAGEECDGDQLGAQTCETLGFTAGELTCHPYTCLLEAETCVTDYTEDFESGVFPTSLSTSGAAWSLSPTLPHAGAYGAKSGFIGNNQTSSMSLTLVFDTGGTIGFWHREDTESCCDELLFYIDGQNMGTYASPAWNYASFSVAAGQHTFTWSYEKDFSASSGTDSVWVDDIVATGGHLP